MAIETAFCQAQLFHDWAYAGHFIPVLSERPCSRREDLLVGLGSLRCRVGSLHRRSSQAYAFQQCVAIRSVLAARCRSLSRTISRLHRFRRGALATVLYCESPWSTCWRLLQDSRSRDRRDRRGGVRCPARAAAPRSSQLDSARNCSGTRLVHDLHYYD